MANHQGEEHWLCHKEAYSGCMMVKNFKNTKYRELNQMFLKISWKITSYGDCVYYLG